MDIRFHSTVLITKRFDEMKRFYTKLLGQRVCDDFGNCVSFDCALTIWELRGGYTFVRAMDNVESSDGNNSMEVCFETDHFEAETARIKAGGAALLHDIEEETWGQRTLRFFDPDGNIVELGESIPCFCRRLHDQGMSAAEVAAKTGIDLDAVEDYLSR